MARPLVWLGCVAWFLASASAYAASPTTPADIDGPLDDSDGIYTISWNASVGTVTAYKLEENSVEIYAGNNRAFKMPAARSGSKTYRVRACNIAECSAYSGTITVVSQTSASTPPTVLAMPTISQSAIDASSRTGTTDGKFRVDESGNATYSIPIATVPGTAGVVPSISLDYSSGRRVSTTAGYGWAVGGLSGIARCRQTLAHDNQALPIQWNGNDRLCLDGQRLVLTSGTYLSPASRYKALVDTFAEIEAVGGSAGNPDYFVATRKDGSVSYYGRNPVSAGTDAKLNEAGGATYTWALKSFEDSAGNHIWFVYANDADGQRISEVRYAYGASVGPAGHNASIVFTYASGRPDPTRPYVAGTEFPQRMRLSGITSLTGATAIRQYNLTYLNTTSSLNKLSRLASIQECSDATNTICLPATNFTWATDYNGYSATASGSINFAPGDDRYVKAFQPADVNGDGYVDFVWVDQNISGGSKRLKYALSNGTTLVQATFSDGSSNIPGISSFDIVDYNLDGRMDVGYHDTSAQQYKILLAEPYWAGSVAAWRLRATAIVAATGVTSAFSTAFFDANSDGLSDYRSSDQLGNLGVRELIRDVAQPDSSATAYTLGTQTAWTFPPTPAGVWRFMGADFNGDGRGDAAVLETTGCVFSSCFVLQTLGIATGTNQLVKYLGAASALHGEPFSTLEDFNGDGLTDVLVNQLVSGPSGNSATAGGNVFVSTGTGIVVTQNGLPGPEAPKRKAVTDYNRDGYRDTVWHDEDASLVKVELWDPQINGFQAPIAVRTTNGSENESHLFLDINSDGFDDYLHFKKDKLTTYLAVGTNQPQNAITSITNGIVGNTTVSYASLATSNHYQRLAVGSTPGQPVLFSYAGATYTYTPATADVASFYTKLNTGFDVPAGQQTLGMTCAVPTGCPVLEMHGPIQIVTAVEGTAPKAGATPGAIVAGAKSKLSYYYGEAKAQASGRGFLGFHSLATIDEQTGVKTITRYRQDFPFTGAPAHTEVLTATGAKLREADTTWSLQNWGGSAGTTIAPHRPFTSQSLEKTYALANNGASQGALLATVTTTAAQDQFGNALTLQTDTRDAVNALVHTKLVTNEYGTTTDSMRFGRLSRTTSAQTRSGLTSTRESTFTYFASGPAYRLLESETIEPTRSCFSTTTTYQRDAFGNITHATKSTPGCTDLLDPSNNQVAASRTTRSVYDANGRFVNETYNALNQRTQLVVARNSLGQPTEIQDIAGLQTSLRYDAFGRKYLERSPTGAFKTTLLSGATASCPAGSTYMATTTGADGSVASECFDGVARTTRKIARGFNGTDLWTDVEYDASGRQVNASVPRVANAPVQPVSFWQRTTYDLLGRPTRVDLPSPVAAPMFATTVYNGLSVTLADALGRSRTDTKNELGELKRVVDHLGGQLDYDYDAEGHVTFATSRRSASDPNAVVVSMQYDALGRKKQMSDPDKGTWVYRYTPFDELKLQRDAKAQEQTIVYDALGRRTSRVDKRSNATTEDTTTWTYATAGSAIGQLQSVAMSGHSQSFTYDSLARPNIVTTTVGAASYTRTTQFDGIGRVWREFDIVHAITGSSGTQPFYNANGHLSHVVDVASGEEVYRVQTQNERGQVTSALVGNLLQATAGYEPETGRTTSQTAQVFGYSAIQQLTYGWDALNNLTWRRNQRTGQDLREAFCYDALNRLSRSTVGTTSPSCGTDDITYDGLGNIATKANVGAYTYGAPSLPHAVASINTGAGIETYSYDANGSLINDSTGRTFTYATFDKPTQIAKGGVTISFLYGTERELLQRTDSEAGFNFPTLFLGNVERQGLGTTQLYRRTLPGGGLFTVTASGTTPKSNDQTYLFKDHLGSTDAIVDDAGATLQQLGFDPWGQRRDAATWAALSGSALANFDTTYTKKGFTGHEMLDKVGVIHMQGRIYDPRIGRFLQADPFVQTSTDTQMFNRYSYVRNNPLNATDPSGHFIFALLAISAIVTTVQAVIESGAIGLLNLLGFVGSALYRGLVYGWGAAIQGAVISGLTMGLSIATGGMFAGFDTWVQVIGQAAVQGTIGGLTSLLQGGKFGDGFVASAASSLGGAAAGYVGGRFGPTAGFVARVVAGGTVSEITGGKFANGALSGAMSAAWSAASEVALGEAASASNGGLRTDYDDAGNVTLSGTLGYEYSDDLEVELENEAGRDQWIRTVNGTYETKASCGFFCTRTRTVTVSLIAVDGPGDVTITSVSRMRAMELAVHPGKNLGPDWCSAACAQVGGRWASISNFKLKPLDVLHEVFHLGGLRHGTRPTSDFMNTYRGATHSPPINAKPKFSHLDELIDHAWHGAIAL